MMKIYYSRIGAYWLTVALENQKIVATAFSRSREHVLRRILQNLPYNIPFQLEEKLTDLSEEILNTLKMILEGEEFLREFDLKMEYLSPYKRRVLSCLRRVPIGYVTTYSELAKVCGGSPKAVGLVMASNPFPLLIPCHRVIRSDMSLGGFGYGVKTKWEILTREDRGYEKPSKVRIFGKNLILYPVKYVKSPS